MFYIVTFICCVDVMNVLTPFKIEVSVYIGLNSVTESVLCLQLRTVCTLHFFILNKK